jgi:hypothetical protein
MGTPVIEFRELPVGAAFIPEFVPSGYMVDGENWWQRVRFVKDEKQGLAKSVGFVREQYKINMPHDKFVAFDERDQVHPLYQILQYEWDKVSVDNRVFYDDDGLYTGELFLSTVTGKPKTRSVQVVEAVDLTGDGWVGGKLASHEILKVTDEHAMYFLEVLPPLFMHRTIDGRRYEYGFVEGNDIPTLFWKNGSDWYCWTPYSVKFLPQEMQQAIRVDKRYL